MGRANKLIQEKKRGHPSIPPEGKIREVAAALLSLDAGHDNALDKEALPNEEDNEDG
jgi:hypothetical protein